MRNPLALFVFFRIEPEDGLDARPDDVAGDAVIPCDDPARRAGGFIGQGAEFFIWRFHPAGPPVQGVQFPKIQVQFLGESFGQGRFS